MPDRGLYTACSGMALPEASTGFKPMKTQQEKKHPTYASVNMNSAMKASIWNLHSLLGNGTHSESPELVSMRPRCHREAGASPDSEPPRIQQAKFHSTCVSVYLNSAMHARLESLHSLPGNGTPFQ